jgi:hypothetical protein
MAEITHNKWLAKLMLSLTDSIIVNKH